MWSCVGFGVNGWEDIITSLWISLCSAQELLHVCTSDPLISDLRFRNGPLRFEVFFHLQLEGDSVRGVR